MLSHCLSPVLQVCLFFQNQLFRGNRVTKVDSRRFAAFCSPNLPPLAVVGTDVTSKWGREQGQPLPWLCAGSWGRESGWG